MVEKFKLEVTTPGKLVFSGLVDLVTIPGEDGEFGVMKGHSPVISGIKPGLIQIFEGTTRIVKRIYIAGGLAEVNQQEANILATDAYDLEQITRAEIDARLSAATVKYNTSENEFDRRRAEEAMNLNKELLSHIA